MLELSRLLSDPESSIIAGMATRTLLPRRRLSGRFSVPGDKSISHRALIFGAIATGTSRVRGLSRGGDVRSTRNVLDRLGVTVQDQADHLTIDGRGFAGLDQPSAETVLELDCGNSGTTARLLIGLLAGCHGRFRLIGDASLSSRPMRRVVEPLGQLGATIENAATLPLTITGNRLRSATVRSEVASAQVKSALILAALQAQGTSCIAESIASRDHTERMLIAMGAPLTPTPGTTTSWDVVGGRPRLEPLDLIVPGDPSSAAFAIGLAAVLPESQVHVDQVSLNPRRLGFYRMLSRMGAAVEFVATTQQPEPVGTISLRSGRARLQGIEVTGDEVVDAIDELPLLATIAAAAHGTTRVTGASELRHKESDRISATVSLLQRFGATARELPDGFEIVGPTAWRAATIDSQRDHRLAMAGAIAASLAPEPSVLTGAHWVEISYPEFFRDLDRLTSS
jgi:3-phosphoshikimate 1-carboxyvinyltransferase